MQCYNDALPDMLLQMAWFLVGLTTELALIWPVIAHHLQVLLESQARVPGGDEACKGTCEQSTCGLQWEKTFHFVHSPRVETSTRKQLNNAFHLITSTGKLCACLQWWTHVYTHHLCVYTRACQHMLLPKSVMRMGSCRGMSGRGRLLLDTLALLLFRGNFCFLCCKLLKWEAMCVFLWPDVRKILSQWGQGKGRTPRKSGEKTVLLEN